MPQSYIDSLLSAHEKVLRVSRQHWFFLVRNITLELISILIIFSVVITTGITVPQYVWIAALIGVILLLIPISTMTSDILKWSNRQYIVTNRRVMQLAGIFNKEITDSSLEKVNDVKMAQSAFGRILNYGDIEILTASELGINQFNKIEDPIHFKKTMLDAKENLEMRDLLIPNNQPEISSPELIIQLENLHRMGVLSDLEYQQKKQQILAKNW